MKRSLDERCWAAALDTYLKTEGSPRTALREAIGAYMDEHERQRHRFVHQTLHGIDGKPLPDHKGVG